jgi:hypothetical protein
MSDNTFEVFFVTRNENKVFYCRVGGEWDSLPAQENQFRTDAALFDQLVRNGVYTVLNDTEYKQSLPH